MIQTQNSKKNSKHDFVTYTVFYYWLVIFTHKHAQERPPRSRGSLSLPRGRARSERHFPMLVLAKHEETNTGSTVIWRGVGGGGRGLFH